MSLGHVFCLLYTNQHVIIGLSAWRLVKGIEIWPSGHWVYYDVVKTGNLRCESEITASSYEDINCTAHRDAQGENVTCGESSIPHLADVRQRKKRWRENIAVNESQEFAKAHALEGWMSQLGVLQ